MPRAQVLRTRHFKLYFSVWCVGNLLRVAPCRSLFSQPMAFLGAAGMFFLWPCFLIFLPPGFVFSLLSVPLSWADFAAEPFSAPSSVSSSAGGGGMGIGLRGLKLPFGENRPNFLLPLPVFPPILSPSNSNLSMPSVCSSRGSLWPWRCLPKRPRPSPFAPSSSLPSCAPPSPFCPQSQSVPQLQFSPHFPLQLQSSPQPQS